MSKIAVKVLRNGLVESIHRADIVVVNKTGKIIYKYGNPNKFTYIRSSAKPIQAINVVKSGAYNYFNFSLKELAIMCSSHFSQKVHVEVIKNILNKLKLDKSYLKCGKTRSRKKRIAIKQAENNQKKSSILNDCSGKHCGFLSIAKYKNYNINNYLNINNPVQI